jgi:hypothetical protein
LSVSAPPSQGLFNGPKTPQGHESNWVQTAPKMKMTTDIPPQITTPDSIETRLGTLKFFDGFPDDATVQKVYDTLDFQRGVQTFLNAMPGASLVGMRTGFRKLGTDNGSILLFANLLDSKSLVLTGNADSIYFSHVAGSKGRSAGDPIAPQGAGAFLDDFWFQYIADMGNAGPDKGQGGKYVVLPPGYKGEVPEGYFIARSRTFGIWLMGRGFKVDGDPKPAAESIKKNLRIYPLAQAKNPPETKFQGHAQLYEGFAPHLQPHGVLPEEVYLPVVEAQGRDASVVGPGANRGNGQ